MYDTDDLTRALAAAATAFLASLEGPAASHGLSDHAAVVGGDTFAGEPIDYDPLLDTPPLPASPVGTPREKKMSNLAYLGAIARINATHQRGARSDEVSELARRAGYPDGRAVSGWNSRPGSPRVIENREGQRILNAEGHSYLAKLADELNLRLQGDLTPLTED